MRCLKYVSPVIMLAFNLAYWLGFHNECKDCKSCLITRTSSFDHRENAALSALRKAGRNRAKPKNEARFTCFPGFKKYRKKE